MLNKFKTFANEQKEGFCSYEWSDKVIQRNKQTFACFGDIAYDVSKLKFYDSPKGTGRLCVPIKGRYLAEFPDEGQSGIMGLYIVDVRGKIKKSSPTFVTCGWVHTKELNLTNQEIKDNIIEDIERGENVLTCPPPGWDTQAL